MLVGLYCQGGPGGEAFALRTVNCNFGGTVYGVYVPVQLCCQLVACWRGMSTSSVPPLLVVAPLSCIAPHCKRTLKQMPETSRKDVSTACVN